MSIVKKIDLIVEKSTRYVAYIGALALLFNMAIVVVYILTRVFGHALVGTEEYVAMGQVILIAMGFAYTQHSRGLVHVGFFMKKLPGPGPMIAWVLDNWIAALVCVLWVYESVIRYPLTKQTSQILGLPFKPFFLVMTIGITIYTLSQIYEAVRCTVGLFNKELRQEIEENWPA